MQHGIVAFFADTRGFGFIQPDDGGAQQFFHIHNVDDAWDEDSVPRGARVTFDTGPSRKDPSRTEAINIKVIVKEGNLT